MTSRVNRTLALLTTLVFLIGIAAPGRTLASAPRPASTRSAPQKVGTAKDPKATNSKAVSRRVGPKSVGPKSVGTKSVEPKALAPRTPTAKSNTRVAIPAKAASKNRAAVTRPQGAPSRSGVSPSPTLRGAGKSRLQAREAPTRIVKSNNRKSDGRKGRAEVASLRRSRRAPHFFDPARPQTLRAEAAVVVDTRTMKVVWAKNSHERRPIASLTKLMTALVFLDHGVPLTDSMTVTLEDVAGAGHSHVRAGNRVAVGDLIRCALISSDNCATRALARSTGLSGAEFVAAMNTKARTLGLRETRYADPTGLDANNLSTAADQARLIILAADNPLIGQITSSPSYTFLCGRRIESLTNTNRLLRSRGDIVGSKTGYINEAGYCLAMLIGDRDNPYLTTVVLGAPSNASRFAESSKLIEWALSVVGPSPAMASPNPSGTAPAPLNQPNRR